MSEKLKNYLVIALIATLVIVAVSVIVYVYYYGVAARQNVTRSFSVNGEGKITAVPDIAALTAGVTTEGGTNLSSLQQDNTKRANQLIEFFKGQGIDAKDIKTQNYSIEPRYQSRPCTPDGICNAPTIIGYTIQQSVAVKIRDLNKVNEIVGGVIGAGANSVSQVSFTIDDPTALQQQARQAAMAAAQEKATAVAKAGNFRIGRLVGVFEDFGPRPFADGFGGGLETMKVAPTPTIEPGSQEVVVNVNLTYEIK